jgi:serine protease Do/serine protease DegQ
VQRGRLGITIQDLTPDLAEALDIDSIDGAVITEVEAGSPAEEAGVKAGDVVVNLNGRAVLTSTSLRNRLGLLRIGEEVTLRIYRRGNPKTIRARIGKPQVAELKGGKSRPELAGATFQDIDRNSRRYGGLKGVVVADVERRSPAWRYGLRAGDIIVAVNRQEVASVAEFESALRRRAQVLALNVLRNGASLFIVIR